DVLETINHQLVAETAKTTAASIVMLANAPSRVRGLEAARTGGTVALTWTASPERDIDHYIVSWVDAAGQAHRIEVASPAATIEGAAATSGVMGVAVNTRGIEAWDRARVRVP